MWVECIRLRLYGGSLAGVGPATVALRNDALDRCFTRRSKQMVKACGTKAVAGRKHLIEVTQIRGPAEVRHLVNDHVGSNGPHDLAHLGPIESIDNGGLAAELSDRADFRRAPRCTDDLMTGSNQPRHEMSTQGTRGAGNEDTHVVYSFVAHSSLSPIETSTQRWLSGQGQEARPQLPSAPNQCGVRDWQWHCRRQRNHRRAPLRPRSSAEPSAIRIPARP